MVCSATCTQWLSVLVLCPCRVVYAPLPRLQLRKEDADRTLNALKGGVTLVKHTIGSSFRMSKVCACLQNFARFEGVCVSAGAGVSVDAVSIWLVLRHEAST